LTGPSPWKPSEQTTDSSPSVTESPSTLNCTPEFGHSSKSQTGVQFKFVKFALPESVEEVKEIEKVIKNLRNRVRGKYEEVAHC